jgi:vesicle-associated membrane protein 72
VLGQILDRGEKIELLVGKTETLQSQVVMCVLCGKCPRLILADNLFFLLNLVQADSFHRHGRELRRKMWLQNLRFKLMVGGAITVLILILWLMVCRGFKC